MMKETELRQYFRTACPTHNKDIIRICTSDQCTKSALACTSCMPDHEHNVMSWLRLDEFAAMLSHKESVPHGKIRNTVSESHKAFRSFAGQIRQAVDIMLAEVTTIGQEIYEKYMWKPMGSNWLSDLSAKTGSELNTIYETYRNMQEQFQRGVLYPPKLLTELMEYKVAFGSLLPRLKQLFEVASVYSVYDTPARQHRFDSKVINTLTEQFEKLYIFADEKPTPEYEKQAKQLKQMNVEKKYQEVVQKATEIIRQYPLLHTAYFEKGFALFELGQFKQSYINYSVCVELGGPPHIANTNRGISMIRLAQYERGIECCDRAIEREPKYANAYCHKAIAYQAMKRYTEAIACYEKAIECRKNFKTAEDLLSALKGKLAEAEEK